MNGFEPVTHRRIIDSTAAGQWNVTYDGPIDECNEVKLKTENDKLRELVRDIWGYCVRHTRNPDYFAEHGFLDRMKELGVGDADAS